MSSWARRAGSATTSISTIFPPRRMNVIAVTNRPCGSTTMPTAPSTNASRACMARRERVSACSATDGAPRTCLCAGRRGAGVGPYDDVRVEQLEQGAEVAVAGSGEEGGHHLPLPGRPAVGTGAVAVVDVATGAVAVVDRGRCLDTAARTAGELPRRGR